MRRIGGILGRSPFGPTHEHLLKVIDALGLVVTLIDAAVKGDLAGVRAAASDISKLESEADAVKKAIRVQFTTSLLAAVSRSEVLALVKAQDDVIDECERLAYELSLRATRFPAFLADGAKAIAAGIAEARGPLSEVSRMLDASGGQVSGENTKKITALIDDIETLATKVGALEDSFLKRLFEREGEVEPLDAVFMLRFAERSEKVAGKIENVADVVSRLVMENG